MLLIILNYMYVYHSFGAPIGLLCDSRYCDQHRFFQDIYLLINKGQKVPNTGYWLRYYPQQKNPIGTEKKTDLSLGPPFTLLKDLDVNSW